MEDSNNSLISMSLSFKTNFLKLLATVVVNGSEQEEVVHFLQIVFRIGSIQIWRARNYFCQQGGVCGKGEKKRGISCAD